MELSQEKNRSAADKSLTSALCIYTYCILYYIMIGFFCRCPEGIGFCIQFWTQSYQYTTPPLAFIWVYILYLDFCVYVCTCACVWLCARMCMRVRVCLYCSIMKRKINTHRGKIFIVILMRVVNEMFYNK